MSVSAFLDVMVIPRQTSKASKRVVQFEPGPGDNYEGPAQAVKITKKKMPDAKTFSTTIPLRTLQEGTPAFVAEARVKKVGQIEPRPSRIVIADAGMEVNPKFPEYYYNDGIRPSRRGITIEEVALPATNVYRQ